MTNEQEELSKDKLMEELKVATDAVYKAFELVNQKFNQTGVNLSDAELTKWFAAMDKLHKIERRMGEVIKRISN